MIKSIVIDNPRSIPGAVKLVVGVASLVLSVLSRDSMLFLYGMAVIIFLVSIMYNEAEPPVLLFSAVMAWLFYQGQLINALVKGEQLIQLGYYSATRPTIVWLGLTAILVFFTGIYLINRHRPTPKFMEVRAFLMKINLERLLLVYIVVNFLLITIGNYIWLLPGLTQPFYMLAQFKWTFFFLLFVTVFAQDRMKFWLLCITVVDIALSFFSFFSHFKEPIYFSFISFWIFYFRASPLFRIIPIFLIVLTFYFGAYWSAIKDEYRNFLNHGTGAQTVVVSRGEAYSKLTDLLSNVQPKDLDTGIEDLVTRLSWIGAFDAVYNHVPKVVRHTNGDLWMEGITRPFLPRLIFPNKSSLADSKELNYYSGLHVDEKNTSISLSTVAGSYIDFGSWGMFVPIFLAGLFCGWLYRKTIRFGRHPVIGYALTMPMIYLLLINEQSINRTCSSLVLFFLVVWFFSRFLLGPLLRFLIPETSQRRAKPAVHAPALG
jgi:hypothetical protein